MARKIYDVVPPKVAQKVEDIIKSLGAKPDRSSYATGVAGGEAKKKVTKGAAKKPKYAGKTPISPIIPPVPQKGGRFPLREVFVGGIIIVLLFGIYFFNKLPKATVEVYPKLDKAELDTILVADKTADDIDLKKQIIPLDFLEEIVEASQEFPATGIASNDGKATGTIKIYNKLSPATPITLISGTHFLSDSGKYFVTLAKVTIPAMKGKTVGSVSVKVQAKEVGSDYNIGPSKFSVPKLSGTTYYYGIWGESTEQMSGGYTGKVKIVTKDDLDSAEDILNEKLLQEAEASLRSKISEDQIILDGAILKSVVQASSDAKANAIVDKFNQSSKVRVQALVIKGQDLEQFSKGSILSQLPEGKNLLESTLSMNYNLDSLDFTNGVEKIGLKASASVYSDMNFSDLPSFLSKKSSDEIREIINSQYGQKISEIKTKFWPFWVKKAPKNENRIQINLNFGQ